MNPQGHAAKAKEIRLSLDRLLPDPDGSHVAAVTELAFGIAHHLIAVGSATQFGQHLDTHEGIAFSCARTKPPKLPMRLNTWISCGSAAGTAARAMER